MNKYLRPMSGRLSVAITMTAAHAQANLGDLRPKPLAPVNEK